MNLNKFYTSHCGEITASKLLINFIKIRQFERRFLTEVNSYLNKACEVKLVAVDNYKTVDFLDVWLVECLENPLPLNQSRFHNALNLLNKGEKQN